VLRRQLKSKKEELRETQRKLYGKELQKEFCLVGYDAV
jgi:hypothetical protein